MKVYLGTHLKPLMKPKNVVYNVEYKEILKTLTQENKFVNTMQKPEERSG